MADYVCNTCGFRVPAGDFVGVAIMKQHLETEHGITVPDTRTDQYKYGDLGNTDHRV